MDPNSSGFIVEDELNESDLTTVSSIVGMNMKQIVDKIQKLEDIVKKNAMGTSNGDQSGMMQIGLQIGEKFGKMEIKMDGIGEMKDGMAKMMKEFKELKKENEGLKEEIGKLAEENGKLKEENAEKGDEMEEMKKAIDELKAAKQKENCAFEEMKEENGRKLREIAELIAQIGGKNAELEGKITGLKEEEEKLKEKMAELEGKITGLKEEEEKLKEKMAELEGKIEEKSKFQQMANTEQIGGVEWVEYDCKAFKLDSLHCGSKLTISEGGFFAKHSGPNRLKNTVLANLPIPSFNSNAINNSTIAFYFEVQILHQTDYYVRIGFCTQQFLLEGYWLGNENNSIGIYGKRGVQIDGTVNRLGNYNGNFTTGNFVGIGIIHKPKSKMECFATWNGQLLGKVALPSKFVDCQLYPAINLYIASDSIRVNFDKDNCQFKEFGRVLQ